MAESGGNPEAFNPANYDGSNDAGLMQINSIHVVSGLIGDQERFNPTENLRAAYAIYKGGGWNAWSAFSSGKYLKFIQ
jgi:soluble lytic murein transglycosylase-like protein